MCCTLESTHPRKELFLEQTFPAKLVCFRGRPHISVVRRNGDERGKLADKFTPCSITVAPASVPSLTTEESRFRVNINNM